MNMLAFVDATGLMCRHRAKSISKMSDVSAIGGGAIVPEQAKGKSVSSPSAKNILIHF
jgi:hypothetical protein